MITLAERIMQPRITDYVESIVRKRVLRSKEARAVSEVLASYARRGEFKALSEGGMRVGRIGYRILWHHERVYRFVFDLEASELCFPELLAPVNARSPVLKELNALLRRCATDDTEQRRIDPHKGHARLFVRRAALSLCMTVKDGHYEYCTQCLVQLAHEVLTTFTGNRPARDLLMHRVSEAPLPL
jgi:hypothetical protein